MPIYVAKGGIASGSRGGITYVLSQALGGPGLPNISTVGPGTTYGRIDGPGVVSLWRYADRSHGVVTTFADSRGFYKGNHNSNPANPTNVLDYYFNDNFEHYRVSSAGLGWINPPNPIAGYLPADQVWIDGDGSNGGQGSYDSDADAIEYLGTTVVVTTENYVFYGRDEDELRVIAGATFQTGPRWEGVSSGMGPVPGPPGTPGTPGSPASLTRTGALPQELSGNIDWDAVVNAGFYTVATGAVQTNAPAGVILGACHVFSTQTYIVQIGWSFETAARTFTRTRPGGAGTPFGGWERIHIPIDSIVELLEARTGDARLLISAIRGIIPVSMLPAAVMLDSEFTAAAVRALLGLTAQEVNDLFTGASIAGQVITYTQNDGTEETITIPVAAGGMADGVVQSGEIDDTGDTLTLTLDTGGTVVIDIPAVLRGSGGFDLHNDVTDEVPSLSAADRFVLSNEGIAGAPNQYVTLTRLQQALVTLGYLTVTLGLATETRVQTLINATNLSALQGQVTDGQIPDAILRDAELTAARVMQLLNLTAQEVNDLFTGASISGQVITYTQNDGTEETITIPDGGGGMADGVVESGAFNTTGTELVLTLDTGSTITINVPAVLRGGQGAGQTADQVGALIQQALAAAVVGNTETGIVVTHNNDGTFDFVVGAVQTHTRYSAIREADNGFNVGSFTNAATGTSSDTDEITIATWDSGERHLAFAQPVSLAEYTDMREQGSPFNARGSFAIHADTLEIAGEDHRIYIFDSTLLLAASGDVWELS